MAELTLPDDAHAHHPFLQHHFEDLGQQHEASTLGMWFFLTTEILFFGGVLLCYWVYRIIYPEAWAVGAAQQNTLFGGINTLVLIVSSLTMALAVRNAQLGRRAGQVAMLIATLIFGSVFLGIKMYEYHMDYVEGRVPGAHQPGAPAPCHAARSRDAAVDLPLGLRRPGHRHAVDVVGVDVQRGGDAVRPPHLPEHADRPADRDDEGNAGDPLLHARDPLHAPDLGGDHRRVPLAGRAVRADVRGLPDAGVERVLTQSVP